MWFSGVVYKYGARSSLYTEDLDRKESPKIEAMKSSYFTGPRQGEGKVTQKVS